MCSPRTCTMCVANTPTATPAVNVTITTRMATMVVLVADTPALPCHRDLDVGVDDRHVFVAPDDTRTDRGDERQRGGAGDERAEPRREQIRNARLRAFEMRLNARADPRQRQLIRLMAQRTRIAAQPLEKGVVSHQRLRTGPPVSPATSSAPAKGGSAPSLR